MPHYAAHIHKKFIRRCAVATQIGPQDTRDLILSRICCKVTIHPREYDRVLYSRHT
jgi:hypothetical protein